MDARKRSLNERAADSLATEAPADDLLDWSTGMGTGDTPAELQLKTMRDLAAGLLDAPSSLRERWWERVTQGGFLLTVEFERTHLESLVQAARTISAEAQRECNGAKALGSRLDALKYPDNLLLNFFPADIKTELCFRAIARKAHEECGISISALWARAQSLAEARLIAQNLHGYWHRVERTLEGGHHGGTK